MKKFLVITLLFNFNNAFSQQISDIHSSTIPDNKYYIKKCEIKPHIITKLIPYEPIIKEYSIYSNEWGDKAQNLNTHPLTFNKWFIQVTSSDVKIETLNNNTDYCHRLSNIIININFHQQYSFINGSSTPHLTCTKNLLLQENMKYKNYYQQALNDSLPVFSKLIENFKKETFPLYTKEIKTNDFKDFTSSRLVQLNKEINNIYANHLFKYFNPHAFRDSNKFSLIKENCSNEYTILEQFLMFNSENEKNNKKIDSSNLNYPLQKEDVKEVNIDKRSDDKSSQFFKHFK